MQDLKICFKGLKDFENWFQMWLKGRLKCGLEGDFEGLKNSLTDASKGGLIGLKDLENSKVLQTMSHESANPG